MELKRLEEKGGRSAVAWKRSMIGGCASFDLLADLPPLRWWGCNPSICVGPFGVEVDWGKGGSARQSDETKRLPSSSGRKEKEETERRNRGK